MILTALAGLALVAALVVLVTAGTVYLVKVRPAVEHDPDTRFWYLFAGLCVLLPAILITAVLQRWAGAVLTLLAAATWWAASRVVTSRMGHQRAMAARECDEAERMLLSARHNSILMSWGRYELDPARAIDFPAMSDVRMPETSALAKAVATAEGLRHCAEPSIAEPSVTAQYRAAVTVLENAFHTAEQAAMDHSCDLPEATVAR